MPFSSPTNERTTHLNNPPSSKKKVSHTTYSPPASGKTQRRATLVYYKEITTPPKKHYEITNYSSIQHINPNPSRMLSYNETCNNKDIYGETFSSAKNDDNGGTMTILKL